MRRDSLHEREKLLLSNLICNNNSFVPIDLTEIGFELMYRLTQLCLKLEVSDIFLKFLRTRKNYHNGWNEAWCI